MRLMGRDRQRLANRASSIRGKDDAVRQGPMCSIAIEKFIEAQEVREEHGGEEVGARAR